MRLLIAFSLILVATISVAEGRKMLGAHEQRHWQAVGRLNFGDGFCTGSLVAVDMVVTAAHCVFANRTGVQRLAEKIHFVAGYRLRKFVDHQKAASVSVHPDYTFSRIMKSDQIATDLALVRLSGDIGKAQPLPLAPGVAKGDEVLILSYGRDRPEILSIQSPCLVENQRAGVAVLDCDVTYGVSGAPVMRMIDGAPHIVAVVSAMGKINGQPRAFAAMLDHSLGAVLAAP
ncbi:MAG: trypsin-like serine protease [Paracoccaceae bacterium]|jgi:V8-like Glu-specific endopeptidase|nr:trypsin-like serine protease [Paracoccaceae bacterium]